MKDFNDKDKSYREANSTKIFNVPFVMDEIKKKDTIPLTKFNELSKDEIMSRAFLAHKEGKILEAGKYYKVFIDYGYSDSVVFYKYGTILEEQGKFGDAEYFFREAINLDSSYEEAYLSLGSILRCLGKFNESEFTIRQLIEINPNSPEAYLNLGTILRDLRQYKDAEFYTLKAIELKPDLAISYSNLGLILSQNGNLLEAVKNFRKAIQINPNLYNAYHNLSNTLKSLGHTEEAEKIIRQSIVIKPDFAPAYSNLAVILIKQGKLDEAELCLKKSINIQPDIARTNYIFSNLKSSMYDVNWKKRLFSDDILKNLTDQEKVDIYFARSNDLHRESKYLESSKYLTLANEIKLVKRPSRKKALKEKAKYLLIESDQEKSEIVKEKDYPVSIFIVGMPRSGSTLLENIISMNPSIKALGETNILHESFKTWKNSNKAKSQFSLASIYKQNLKYLSNEYDMFTNKQIYNFVFCGIIANQIPNAKIIHCFRNPLDNILSIYRAHFANENSYASSLIDCAEVYLNQEEVMEEYKKRYRKMIYDFNYDLLVNEPLKEIQSLIQWLNLEWNDKYLSPQHNTRSVSTASYAQVRSPINNKSVGGWKNYREMMQPAIEVIMSCSKYKNLIS